MITCEKLKSNLMDVRFQDGHSVEINGSIVNTDGSKYKDRIHILAYVGKRNTVESPYQ